MGIPAGDIVTVEQPIVDMALAPKERPARAKSLGMGIGVMR